MSTLNNQDSKAIATTKRNVPDFVKKANINVRETVNNFAKDPNRNLGVKKALIIEGNDDCQTLINKRVVITETYKGIDDGATKEFVKGEIKPIDNALKQIVGDVIATQGEAVEEYTNSVIVEEFGGFTMDYFA